MKSSLLVRHALSAFGLILFLALLAYLGKRNDYSIDDLTRLSVGSFIATFLCFAGTMLMATLMQAAILATLGKHVRVRDLFVIGAISYLVNYVPFRPGTVAQAVTLKKLSNIGYVDFAVLTLVTKVAMMIAGVLVFLACLLAKNPNLNPIAAATIPVALLIVATLARAISSRDRTSRMRVNSACSLESAAPMMPSTSNKLELLLSAGRRYLRFANFQSVLVLMELSAVLVALQAIRFLVLAHETGNELGIVQSVGLSGAAMAGYVINILPAGMGTKEGGVLLGATLLDINPATISPMLIADRVLDFVSSVILGLSMAMLAYRLVLRKQPDER